MEFKGISTKHRGVDYPRPEGRIFVSGEKAHGRRADVLKKTANDQKIKISVFVTRDRGPNFAEGVLGVETYRDKFRDHHAWGLRKRE